MAFDQIGKEVAEIHSKIHNFTPMEFLSPIWQTNITHSLRSIIYNDTTFKEKLRQIHRNVHYSLQNNISVIDSQIDWWINYFENSKIEWKNYPESEFVDNEFCRVREGVRFSPDLGRRLIHNHLIDTHFDLPKNRRLMVLELGAGYGGFPRLFKLRHPNSTYFIIDIPDTLVISLGYLRSIFPGLKFMVITSPDQILDEATIKEMDFIFVPVGLDKVIHNQEIDLFVNTHSLGEMPNKAVLHWMDLIQNRIFIKNAFLLNRYLNRLNPREQYRLFENTASCLFEPKWEVVNWEFEPSFMKCPVNETIENQCLLLMLKRDMNRIVDPIELNESSKRHLEFVKSQDWFKFSSSYNPITNVRDIISPFIYPERVPDFSINGTLFHLWESIRLKPSKENVSVMIMYLKYINFLGQPFEEITYYIDLYQRLQS
jgi:putative sugar O-methyltransferase